jgi:hypothetical protein
MATPGRSGDPLVMTHLKENAGRAAASKLLDAARKLVVSEQYEASLTNPGF